ncbi:uncharacterized protein LOC103947475 [Pyrus x bretschneideri]|uniref:uncharacterized protein LOC103947475 n=1 Tax=Pyrus x bretschneideri TaxID=225117 RepID=UPI00202FD066|nr:uncharacterized protein LOC103947475 [Pyrus x bretschneideri]
MPSLAISALCSLFNFRLPVHLSIALNLRLLPELKLLLTDLPPLPSCTTSNRITRFLSPTHPILISPNPIPDGIQIQNLLHRQHRKVHRLGQRQGQPPHLLSGPRNYPLQPDEVQSPRELQGSGLQFCPVSDVGIGISLEELCAYTLFKIVGSKRRRRRRSEQHEIGFGHEYTSLKNVNESKHGFWGVLARKAKDILDDDDNGVQDYHSSQTTRTDMLSMPTRGLCWSKNCAGKCVRVMDFGMKCRGYRLVLLKGELSMRVLLVYLAWMCCRCGVVQEKRF